MALENRSSLLDKIGSYIYGEKFNPWFLIIASLFIMFFLLGGRDLWTQETRWANICQQMLIRHEYFHPYLDSQDYYDKPLLSYWMMIGLSYFIGLGRWALRIPGALAGLLSIWACYKIGEKFSERKAGIIGAWMLAATFWFVFWSRVSCADMLNVGGIMFAVAWFILRKDKLNFFSYIVLFISLAISAQCKGLVAPVVAGLIVLPILIHDRDWKSYFKPSMWVALIIAGLLYVVPFVVSSIRNSAVGYQESGLYLVFRENILRYFEPFDHEGPIYTYILYLPLYAAPWIIFTLAGIWKTIRNWKNTPFSSKYYIYALAIVFIFFTISGSRRSYYVLPMVPLAILIAADFLKSYAGVSKLLSRLFTVLLILSFAGILIFQIITAVGYSSGGDKEFAHDIYEYSTQIQPLNNWTMVYADYNSEGDAREVNFYLGQDKLPEFRALNDIRLNPDSSDIIVINRKTYEDSFKQQVESMGDKFHIIYSKPIAYRKHKDSDKLRKLFVAIVPVKPAQTGK